MKYQTCLISHTAPTDHNRPLQQIFQTDPQKPLIGSLSRVVEHPHKRNYVLWEKWRKQYPGWRLWFGIFHWHLWIILHLGPCIRYRKLSISPQQVIWSVSLLQANLWSFKAILAHLFQHFNSLLPQLTILSIFWDNIFPGFLKKTYLYHKTNVHISFYINWVQGWWKSSCLLLVELVVIGFSWQTGMHCFCLSPWSPFWPSTRLVIIRHLMTVCCLWVWFQLSQVTNADGLSQYDSPCCTGHKTLTWFSLPSKTAVPLWRFPSAIQLLSYIFPIVTSIVSFHKPQLHWLPGL